MVYISSSTPLPVRRSCPTRLRSCSGLMSSCPMRSTRLTTWLCSQSSSTSGPKQGLWCGLQRGCSPLLLSARCAHGWDLACGAQSAQLRWKLVRSWSWLAFSSWGPCGSTCRAGAGAKQQQVQRGGRGSRGKNQCGGVLWLAGACHSRRRSRCSPLLCIQNMERERADGRHAECLRP